MKIRLLNKLLFFYCCTLSISCNHSYQKVGFQEGDLLFQNLNCGELCNAIEAVTEGIDGKDFSHIALVVNVNDTLKVIEAIGNNVQINSLETFFSRSGDTAKIENVTVGRLKKQYKNLIPKAIAEAKKIIGQPYDNIFLLNNGKMYCSEMIYEIFKESNKTKDFFVLEPMTFKDPKTKVFFPAWVNYYKHLNKEIPEGLLGINPGLISRSNKISILKIENYK